MKPVNVIVNTKTILSDFVTPVSLYLTIRKIYPKSILLESSDYHGNENSYSFLCFDPVSTYEINGSKATVSYQYEQNIDIELTSVENFRKSFTSFLKAFNVKNNPELKGVNGIFGYSSFDAVQHFETIKFKNEVNEKYQIPELSYSFYRYIIAINHFNNELHIIENVVEGDKSNIDKIQSIINVKQISIDGFIPGNDEQSNITDEEYKQMVAQGKYHCQRGDVFQIVLSRQFSQSYKGDDFNVYRALRSVNPSPYLFYFDYGSFRIFGSSPEAQLKIENKRAVINPIAGTFKRTGDDIRDHELAQELADDPKENAEHVMLVDLARNDLSRYADDVRVDNYREIQYYSHVLHMVSTVSGRLHKPDDVVNMMMATFPAGTLSGAPKYKAMELIDKYENQNRGYYGGAIGYIGFNGSLNQAIMIRTVLSKDKQLYYQAGAGIVSVSKEESELQEVFNKLGAIKKAIKLASKI